MVWAALTFITKLPKPIDTPVVIKVVRVSGTIKKAEEEVIRRAKELVLRAKVAENGGGDAEIVRDVVKAVEKRRETEVMVVEEEGEESESE
jgi:ribonuclease P/MRP protein subunit POP5